MIETLIRASVKLQQLLIRQYTDVARKHAPPSCVPTGGQQLVSLTELAPLQRPLGSPRVLQCCKRCSHGSQRAQLAFLAQRLVIIADFWDVAAWQQMQLLLLLLP